MAFIEFNDVAVVAVGDLMITVEICLEASEGIDVDAELPSGLRRLLIRGLT